MDVIMPQLGETVTEGKIGIWFKSVGDTVEAGENLFEIETDKVTMEVQATESGVVSEIRVGTGETVPVGTVVAVLGRVGEATSESARKNAATALAGGREATAQAQEINPRVTARGSQAKGCTPITLKPFEEVRTPSESYGPAEAPLGLKITPLARRLVKQNGLDLVALARSVRERGGWRIAAADVKAAHARPPIKSGAGPAHVSIVPGASDRVEPLNRIRAQAASHLAEAWRTAPHVFQAVEVDFSGIDRARQAAKQTFLERHGVALTYLPFIARAVCLALAEFPRINATFDKDRLIVHRDVHLGIAVDLSHEGLVVPVVRHADEMTTSGLAKAIARQIDKARGGKLTPGDLEGGTYTISNNGSFGTLFTAPIINVPQVAILSTDAVRKRPVVVETEHGDAIAVRPVAVVGQSFDHRAFDGAYSASFLKRLKEIAETRDWSVELA